MFRMLSLEEIYAGGNVGWQIIFIVSLFIGLVIFRLLITDCAAVASPNNFWSLCSANANPELTQVCIHTDSHKYMCV